MAVHYHYSTYLSMSSLVWVCLLYLLLHWSRLKLLGMLLTSTRHSFRKWLPKTHNLDMETYKKWYLIYFPLPPSLPPSLTPSLLSPSPLPSPLTLTHPLLSSLPHPLSLSPPYPPLSLSPPLIPL